MIHIFNVFFLLIDTTFSSSSTYFTYVQLAAGKAKKGRKGKNNTESEFRGCTSRRLELLCACSACEYGGLDSRTTSFLRFNIILLMSWDPHPCS